MANYVFIATSIDGYIATSDGGIDWLDEIPNTENSDFGYYDFIAKIDALVMGRNSFDKVMSFGVWPYKKPVFVFSNTLKELPVSVSGKAELITGDPKSVVKALAERGIHNLYIDGGKTIQGFLKEDLIDEMTITTIPILLGGGVPLFGEMEEPIRWDLVKTEVLLSQLVLKHYRKRR